MKVAELKKIYRVNKLLLWEKKKNLQDRLKAKLNEEVNLVSTINQNNSTQLIQKSNNKKEVK